MWPRATNPENWLPQSQFIKVISTVRIGRTGGSEIHERVAQLFVVVHKRKTSARFLCRLAARRTLIVIVQFCGQPPRQPKSGDEAVERSVLRNMVLGIDDLQHQSALRLAQRLNERAVAFLDLPLRRRQLRRGVEAVVQILQQFVHVLASLQHKHIPQVSRNSY